MPALIACLALSGLLWYPPFSVTWLDASGLALFYVANFFRDMCSSTSLGHLWSLSVEEQFYMVWPLLLLLLLRKGSLGRLLLVTATLIGAGALSRALMFALFGRSEAPIDLYTFTPTRIDALLLGALASLALFRPAGRRVAQLASRWFVPEFTLLLSLILLVSINCRSHFLYQYGFTAFALACALSILATVHRPDSSLSLRCLTHPVLRWVGKRSYGIYLYHLPLFLFFKKLQILPDVTSLAIINPLRIGITLIVAELSYRYLEQPFLNLKERFYPVQSGSLKSG